MDTRGLLPCRAIPGSSIDLSGKRGDPSLFINDSSFDSASISLVLSNSCLAPSRSGAWVVESLARLPANHSPWRHLTKYPLCSFVKSLTDNTHPLCEVMKAVWDNGCSLRSHNCQSQNAKEVLGGCSVLCIEYMSSKACVDSR